MEYQLLAADMDGTLLNSAKTISKGNIAAINKALDAGKHVVICTGRGMGELKEFLPMFPKMRYVLSENGGCIYDIQEKKAVFQLELDKNVTETVLHYAEQRDIMPQILMKGTPVMTRSHVDNLGHFSMAHYSGAYHSYGWLVDNAYEYYRQSGQPAEKICLYHTSAEARNQTYTDIRHLPVTVVFSEATSLEITPLGVDKGKGLQQLCEHLHIFMPQTIAIGDSLNDESVLRTAGLSVAVGNADAEIKEICDHIVASNDDDGVAEAIEIWLLG